MTEWPKVKLSNLCLKITDGSHNPPLGVTYSNYLMLSSKNIGNDRITLDEPRYLSEKDFLSENRRTEIEAGDVLLTIVGTIGRVAVVPKNMGKIVLQRSVAVLKPNVKLVNSRYLMFVIQSMTNELDKEAKGVAQQGIYLGQVKNLSIPLPPLDIQKQISDTLDKASRLIELRKQQLEKMDLLIKSKFINMFGDPVMNRKQWPSEKLGLLCDIFRGGSPRPIEKFLGGKIPWIKIGDATKGDEIFVRSTKEHIIEEGIKKSRFVKEGSLIFANCGVSLGFARIIQFDGCIHDGWLSFENINCKLNKIFFLKSLNQCTEHFRKIAPEGTQPNLNTIIMKQFEQILPPYSLQNQFAEFIETVEEKKTKMLQGLDKLELNNRALMQGYFG